MRLALAIALTACHPDPQPVRVVPTPAVEDAGKPPLTVAPAVLEQRRIAGTIAIVPDDTTKIAMYEAHKARVTAAFTVCVSATGEVTQIRQLQSSGLPKYDERIQRVIRETWRYRPFEVNGQPAPICTAVTFIYRQPLGPTKP